MNKLSILVILYSFMFFSFAHAMMEDQNDSVKVSVREIFLEVYNSSCKFKRAYKQFNESKNTHEKNFLHQEMIEHNRAYNDALKKFKEQLEKEDVKSFDRAQFAWENISFILSGKLRELYERGEGTNELERVCNRDALVVMHKIIFDIFPKFIPDGSETTFSHIQVKNLLKLPITFCDIPKKSATDKASLLDNSSEWFLDRWFMVESIVKNDDDYSELHDLLPNLRQAIKYLNRFRHQSGKLFGMCIEQNKVNARFKLSNTCIGEKKARLVYSLLHKAQVFEAKEPISKENALSQRRIGVAYHYLNSDYLSIDAYVEAHSDDITRSQLSTTLKALIKKGDFSTLNLGEKGNLKTLTSVYRKSRLLDFESPNSPEGADSTSEDF